MSTRAAIGLSVAALLTGCAAPASAIVVTPREVVDQSNESHSAMNAVRFFEPVGQSFTPRLDSIDFVDLLLVDTSTGNIDHTIFLNIRDLTIDGPIVGSSLTIELPDCFNHGLSPGCGWAGGIPEEVRLDFDTAVPLTPGSVYVMELVTTGDIGVHHERVDDLYAGGAAIFDGVEEPGWDLWFRQGTTIPEPSTNVMLIVGLIGATMQLMRRRERR